MRSQCIPSAALAMASLTLLIAAAPVGAQYSRRTPIVEAVEKSRGSILTLKVEKKGGFGKLTELVGTGVIIDERGYAITNRHVVQSAGLIRAFPAEGSPVTAKVVLEDAAHDLAILKLEGAQLYRPLSLGPSCDVMVGEAVIAVGNPFGYTNTVSRGIVSALNREIQIPSGETLTGLIQTDAPINPGSSGGPLININGELIGINVAMREGAQGIGFAIPSDTIKAVLASRLSAKRLNGVDHGLACAERVESEGADRQHVVVTKLVEHSLAASAGIKPGDELVQVSGRQVSNRFDVERALWDVKPGEKISFLVHRSGQKVDLTVTVPTQLAGK
jgi:S1-C subfamily serine protease